MAGDRELKGPMGYWALFRYMSMIRKLDWIFIILVLSHNSKKRLILNHNSSIYNTSH